MLNFLHTYTPESILISIGQFSVHWYGLLLAGAILSGYGLAIKLARRRDFDLELISSIYTNLIIWGFVGARIYHVLNDWLFYWQNPAKIIAVWEGGLAIHGGIIAGAITLYYYARRHKTEFWPLADLFSLPLILGQALGRWGNYFNQELFGQPTNLPWGIPISIQNRPAEYIGNNYFHPTFLYESIWDFLVLGALYYLWRKNKKQPGVVFWAYITLYSLGRLVVETLRVNPTPIIFGYRWPAVVSLVLVAIGIVMINWRGRRDSNP